MEIPPLQIFMLFVQLSRERSNQFRYMGFIQSIQVGLCVKSRKGPPFRPQTTSGGEGQLDWTFCYPQHLPQEEFISSL